MPFAIEQGTSQLPVGSYYVAWKTGNSFLYAMPSTSLSPDASCNGLAGRCAGSLEAMSSVLTKHLDAEEGEEEEEDTVDFRSGVCSFIPLESRVRALPAPGASHQPQYLLPARPPSGQSPACP